ncbi:hypothetical protein EES40_06310 [Streptomyces sp. ADI93-02]|nr:hypothetical protein EES40_06310 [Streptomyces sp. ADI93-02]
MAAAANGIQGSTRARARSMCARNSAACQGSTGRSSAPSSPSDTVNTVNLLGLVLSQ